MSRSGDLNDAAMINAASRQRKGWERHAGWDAAIGRAGRRLASARGATDANSRRSLPRMERRRRAASLERVAPGVADGVLLGEDRVYSIDQCAPHVVAVRPN
jgi:hypothetical protein